MDISTVCEMILFAITECQILTGTSRRSRVPLLTPSSFNFNPDADETITIKCPDKPDGAGRNFHFQRHVLQRSPILKQFFSSAYYLHGCDMRLTFTVDPAICVDILYKYLDSGPDPELYHHTVLKVQLTMRFQIADRALILVRLYSLAQKLGLPELMDMAYGVLTDGDKLIKAYDCVPIASLIFTHGGNFDKKLRDWCIGHVKSHARELKRFRIWHEVVGKSENDLRYEWVWIMAGMRPPRLAPVVADGRMDVYQAIKSLAPPEQDRYLPVQSKEQSFQAIIDEVSKNHQAGTESDQEWELSEVVAATTPRSQVGTDSKINQLLGPPQSSPSPRFRGLRHSPSAIFSPNIDKARFVMGYPGTVWEQAPGTSTGSTTPVPTPTKTTRKTKLWTGH